MKKIKYLLLSACMLSMTAAFAFTACSDNKEPVDTTNPEEPSTFVEDTTTYYAIGTGAGDLSASSWDMNYTGLSFVKDTTVTDANVYTLTMKMYAGDHFQIIHDASWNGQMGASYLSGAIGYGSYAYATFDSENKMELFGGGDWGSDIEAAQGGVYTFTLTTYPGSTDLNTITYTRVVNYDMTIRGDVAETDMTDIGGNWEYVLIVDEDDLKRDAQGAVVADGAEYAAVQVYNSAKSQGYYLAEGDYTAYNDTQLGSVNLLPKGAYYITFSESSDKIAITPTAHDIEIQGIQTPVKMAIGEGAWTATVTVVASDYAESQDYAELSLYDRVSGGSLATLQLSAGTYAIKYTESGVAYEELAYYLVGTFANAGWDISDNSVELQATDRSGVYNATFMLADMTANNDWLTAEGGTDAEGRTAIFAFRVVYGSKLNGIAEWCDASNTFVYEAGEATVTFVRGGGIYISIDTSKDGTEYAEDTNQYGLAGTINKWTTEFEDNLAFEKDTTVTDKNVYKLTVTLAADAEIKVVIYGSWDNAMGADKVTGIGTDLTDSDGNIKVVTAGEYTFTLTTYPNNPAQNTLTYTVVPSTGDDEGGNEEDGNTDSETGVNAYHLVGSGSLFGDGQSWNTGYAEYAFTKTSDNVYTITVTLAAGDEFKMVKGDGWDIQIGGSAVQGVDLVDSDGNIKVVTSGEYTLTITIGENGTVSLTYTLA